MIRASDTLAARMIRQSLNRMQNMDLTDPEKLMNYNALLAAATAIESEMLRISLLRFVDARLSKVKAAS